MMKSADAGDIGFAAIVGVPAVTLLFWVTVTFRCRKPSAPIVALVAVSSARVGSLLLLLVHGAVDADVASLFVFGDMFLVLLLFLVQLLLLELKSFCWRLFFGVKTRCTVCVCCPS